MKISILISTKNREEILIQTLKVIERNTTLKDFSHEIVVTNDGEAFQTFQPLAFEGLNIKAIENKGNGLAAGRNNGVENSTGDIIVFYDDDILPEPDHFSRHLHIHRHYENLIVTANRFYPKVLIQKAEGSSFGRYKLQYEYNWLNGLNLNPFNDHKYLQESETLAGFSCSMRRSSFIEVGPFNENFPAAGCEDNEFFHRAKKKNFKLIFDKENICYHNELDNFNLQGWLRRQSSGIKGAVILCELYPEGKNHPTYYLNTPLKLSDSIKTNLTRLKRTFLAIALVRSAILAIIKITEALHLPDSFLFRLYNAAWLGHTKASFMEQYQLKKFQTDVKSQNLNNHTNKRPR